MFALSLTMTLGQTFTCKDATPWDASYDGRQNPANPASGGYVEWWFFTGFSAAADTGFAMTYDPSQRGVSFMLYEHAASDPSQARVINFARSFPSVTVGAANATQTFDSATGVNVINQTTYEIRGVIDELRWKLTYRQAVPAAREHVDLAGVAKLDWISYMPSAVLSGWLEINGTKYDFSDGVGYHDHNSGKWPKHVVEGASGAPISFDYKWGSLNGGDSGIGGVYGAYLLPKPLAEKSVDYVFVRAHGKRVEFGTLCGHKVKVTPRSFVTHSDGRKEATAMLITAESADWSLTWSHAMLSSAANPGGKGLGLVVYEQLSMHNLTLTQKSTGQKFAETAAPGFTEWSDPA